MYSSYVAPLNQSYAAPYGYNYGHPSVSYAHAPLAYAP